jgi:hypothetical protein
VTGTLSILRSLLRFDELFRGSDRRLAQSATMAVMARFRSRLALALTAAVQETETTEDH